MAFFNGSYTGNGGASQVISPTGAASLAGVIVYGKGSGGTKKGFIRTSDMSASTGIEQNESDRITALAATSFTVAGTGSDGLNVNGQVYHYLSWANDSYIKSGTYTGDGPSAATSFPVAGTIQSITGPGFYPDLVWVREVSTSTRAWWKSRSMAQGMNRNPSYIFLHGISFFADDGFLCRPGISSSDEMRNWAQGYWGIRLDNGGFSVSGRANYNTVTYYYLAIRETTNYRVVTYGGQGDPIGTIAPHTTGTPRTLGGLPFQPHVFFTHANYNDAGYLFQFPNQKIPCGWVGTSANGWLTRGASGLDLSDPTVDAVQAIGSNYVTLGAGYDDGIGGLTITHSLNEYQANGDPPRPGNTLYDCHFFGATETAPTLGPGFVLDYTEIRLPWDVTEFDVGGEECE